MKLRRIPEDFQVEELTDLVPRGGPYALFRLTKRSIGTPEAIELIGRKLHVPRFRISYGGLKDRHAVTKQFVTIQNGSRRNFEDKGLSFEYLGQADRPFTPKEIAGNRFEIVMRDLSEAAAGAAEKAVSEVSHDGLPNYFDDQRFGSVGASGEFIGHAWCQGNYERALWLALADPHPDDRPDEREQKRILREHWGRWRECKGALARSHRRSIVTYLADKPEDRPDYRGAFARIKVDLRGIYLAAFQSALWNRMLARHLQREIAAECLTDVSLQLGPVPFFRGLSDAQCDALFRTELPLPSARLHLDAGPMLDLINEVVAAQGLELRELRVKYPRDSFFSKGSRAAAIRVQNLTHEVADDDLYAGRRRMKLRFDLPRGSYATILVKRLTECADV
jgi:tRNA pseudouridine13 synthase